MTTTWPTIRDQIRSKIIAITPSHVGTKQHGFDRSPKRWSLRAWAGEHPESEAFRKFEVRLVEQEEPPLQDPSAFMVKGRVIVVVAYPILPALYGNEESDEIEKVILTDAHQIRDVVFSSGNYVAGQQSAIPAGLPEIDKSSDAVWFLTLPFDVEWYAAQSLT